MIDKKKRPTLSKWTKIICFIGISIIVYDRLRCILNKAHKIFYTRYFLEIDTWFNDMLQNTSYIYILGLGVLVVIPFIIAFGYCKQKPIWKRILVLVTSIAIYCSCCLGVMFYFTMWENPWLPQNSKLESCVSEENDVRIYAGKVEGTRAGIFLFRQYGPYRIQLLDYYENMDSYECIWGENEVQVILREGKEEKK